MKRTVDLLLTPKDAADPARVKDAAALAAGLRRGASCDVRVLRRSVDARSRTVRVQLRVDVSDEELPRPTTPDVSVHDVSGGAPVVIVGAGPAGLFAALHCISRGARPIVLERGKDVRARRHDLAALTQRHVVDPDSNYCFGEGGAGTYSDGKLYTRSGKRGDISAVLETFVAHGASSDILVDAHPHIGTNKLPAIIASMREAIRSAGGEVRFGARVTELVLADGGAAIEGVTLASGDVVRAARVILATGHSARDVFEMLLRQGIAIARKDFALGVRVEHPQSVIDEIRYRQKARDPYLPAASYSAVEQIDGRGVYAFCMCPGGIIAPCATAPGEVVTNGWSPSKRNNPFANSGIVVEVKGSDDAGQNPLGGVEYQRAIEHAAWDAGGRTQVAPAQRMVDFIEGRFSSTLPACSYPPGLISHRIDELLPSEIATRLQGGLRAFGRAMRGYLTNDAVVVAVESRTSSPVRVPRNADTLEHIVVRGLYPSGEGAGYAGGIVSAAIDGIRCADKACDGL